MAEFKPFEDQARDVRQRAEYLAASRAEHALANPLAEAATDDEREKKSDAPTDDEVNAVALHYWGPSVIYDREKLREALALIRRSEAHTPTDGERKLQGMLNAARIALESVWSVIQRDVRSLANLDPVELGGIVARALDPDDPFAVPETHLPEPQGERREHSDADLLSWAAKRDEFEPQGEPSGAKVEAAARRLFGATVNSMTLARELARVALLAKPLVECPHWAPGKITFRNGCTACAEQGEAGTDDR